MDLLHRLDARGFRYYPDRSRQVRLRLFCSHMCRIWHAGKLTKVGRGRYAAKHRNVYLSGSFAKLQALRRVAELNDRIDAALVSKAG